MLTKMLAAVVMAGALYVAGDAAYQKFGCCPTPASGSCGSITSTDESDCCASSSSCCSAAKSSCCTTTVKAAVCCDAEYTYCTRTGQVYEGCCCEVVGPGLYRCLITGEVSEECCCVPIQE